LKNTSDACKVIVGKVTHEYMLLRVLEDDVDFEWLKCELANGKKTSYDIEAKNKIFSAQDRQKSYVAEIYNSQKVIKYFFFFFKDSTNEESL